MADGSGLVAMIAPPAITIPSQISRTFAQSTEVPMSAFPKGRSKAVKAQIKAADPNRVEVKKPLLVELREGEDMPAAAARLMLNPNVGAAVTTDAYRPFGLETLPLGRLIENLAGHCSDVRSGDLSQAESMLVSQAHTLDAIFNRLAVQASLNMGQHVDAMDKYLRLALKAQAQSRATLETLANIKNPPIVYARQANFANGPQQVNNGVTAEPAHAAKTEIGQNELLEVGHEQRMDARAQGATGRGDQEVAAVVAVHGAQDGKRKGRG
ncbi:MAG: hypothetical protein K0M70_02960 [Arenimonas sp.]|uniref:hypothetical protein n=1 Tax=Arenimonas sp. TaxID=1872635 RepID=UPI0025BE7790|nr:hypothetical protein [Arenimonas sp.]MBW8366802.1 hypothetical protein [Arenimonas sp.]